MKVEFHLSIGYPGADRTETVEVEDDLTDEELDESLQEWTYNYIESSWSKK